VVTVQGGEFDGTQFYDFSEVMGDMVIETAKHSYNAVFFK